MLTCDSIVCVENVELWEKTEVRLCKRLETFTCQIIKSYFNPNFTIFIVHRKLNHCKNPLDKSFSYGFGMILYFTSFNNVEIASIFYDDPLIILAV